MFKNFLRGFGALTLAVVPLIASSPVQAAQAPGRARAAQVTTLPDAIGRVRLADEDRSGYTRSPFRHWNAGDIATDGCNTRNEVLVAEAVMAPAVGPGCRLTGGVWFSYYDGQEVTDPGAVDIDHMVPPPPRPGIRAPPPGRPPGVRPTPTIRARRRRWSR